MRSGLELAGRYRLEEPLGRGGMGEVWRGVDVRLRRAVAVKILPLAAGAERGAVARFRREAEIAAALNHPGITTVFDIDEHPEGAGNLLFLVMELMHGRDLQAVIADHPHGLPVEQVVELGRQVLEALAAAHAEGVVHRDIKPGNLFLLRTERVKICDFGIARLADATKITATGGISGTPLYMAPEQIQARTVDHRADLYAFGCVLYELLTGSSWLDVGTGVGSILYQHLDHRPAPLRDRRPDVPAQLDRLVLDLLAKDPADRPADATAAADRLTGRRPADEPPARPTLALSARPPAPAPTPTDPTATDPTPTAPTATEPQQPGAERRSTATRLTLTSLAVLALGAAVTVAAMNLPATASSPDSFKPLHKDETGSGQSLTIGQTARVPFRYDARLNEQGSHSVEYSRITLGLTITAIDTNVGKLPADTAGRAAFCIRFRVTNLTNHPIPAGLSLDTLPPGGLGFHPGLQNDGPVDQPDNRQLHLIEGILPDGTLTEEPYSTDSPDCGLRTSGDLPPGASFDQATIVLAPTTTAPKTPLTGVRWTERTESNHLTTPTLYTVSWK